jgi:hypothetical protein
MDYSGGTHFPKIGVGRHISGIEDGFWDGYIDEVGIWNKTLSPNEVTLLYNNNIGLTYPFFS